MSVGAIFGALVIIAGLASWASREPAVQKLWFIMLLEWSLPNLAVAYFGFDRAMLVIPSINGVLAIFVAIVGVANWRRRVVAVASSAIFVLYGAVGVTHVAAFVTRSDGSNLHYAILNGLYSLQLLTLGGVGGWLAVHHRLAGRHQRARLDPSRG